MKILRMDKKDIYAGDLILVNKNHPVKRQIRQNNAVLVPVASGNADIVLQRRTSAMLSRLIFDLKCDGRIIPVSGYRTLRQQQQIYCESLASNGYDFTAKYVALPNRSEHQTGLAVDLAEKQKDIDFIRPNFPYSGICRRFRQKAGQYGFIERYPRGKEKITGIAHEPWHFRYVSYPHAGFIRDNGLTLEEYIEAVKEFPYQKEHLKINLKKYVIEIFYVRVSDEPQTIIEVPENFLYQISGNNVDGFIVTLWEAAA